MVRVKPRSVTGRAVPAAEPVRPVTKIEALEPI